MQILQESALIVRKSMYNSTVKYYYVKSNKAISAIILFLLFLFHFLREIEFVIFVLLQNKMFGALLMADNLLKRTKNKMLQL